MYQLVLPRKTDLMQDLQIYTNLQYWLIRATHSQVQKRAKGPSVRWRPERSSGMLGAHCSVPGKSTSGSQRVYAGSWRISAGRLKRLLEARRWRSRWRGKTGALLRRNRSELSFLWVFIPFPFIWSRHPNVAVIPRVGHLFSTNPLATPRTVQI